MTTCHECGDSVFKRRRCGLCGSLLCRYCFHHSLHLPSPLPKTISEQLRALHYGRPAEHKRNPPSPDTLEQQRPSKGRRPWFPAIH